MSDAPVRRGPLPFHLWEGAALVLVAILCLGFQLRLPYRLVEPSDYEAVGKVLASEAQAGDVVLLYPWWTERARLFAPEGLPVVGYLGSDAAPLPEYKRIWVLAEPKLPGSDLSGFEQGFVPRRKEIGNARTFGNLRLSLYENGRYRPQRWSAVSALGAASAAIVAPDGRREPCQNAGASLRCRSGELNVQWHEILFQPRRCIRFNPPGGGAKTEVTFSGLPAADALVLDIGYLWDRGSFVTGYSGSDAVLTVNGQAQTVALPAGVEGYHHVEVPSLPAGSQVSLSIAAANPLGRDVCFELTAVGNTP